MRKRIAHIKEKNPSAKNKTQKPENAHIWGTNNSLISVTNKDHSLYNVGQHSS